VQHAVQRDAVDLGGPVKDSTGTVGLVRVKNDEVWQEPVVLSTQLIRFLLTQLLHIALVHVFGDRLGVQTTPVERS
jgi:hypothetical protein